MVRGLSRRYARRQGSSCICPSHTPLSATRGGARSNRHHVRGWPTCSRNGGPRPVTLHDERNDTVVSRIYASRSQRAQGKNARIRYRIHHNVGGGTRHSDQRCPAKLRFGLVVRRHDAGGSDATDHGPLRKAACRDPEPRVGVQVFAEAVLQRLPRSPSRVPPARALLLDGMMQAAARESEVSARTTAEAVR